MDDLKFLLIDRLKSKGIDPSLIPAFLKALTYIISSEPEIGLAQTNRKMHSLGWNEVTVDYHCLQIAIACLEADTK
jgi:hypothetical protein